MNQIVFYYSYQLVAQTGPPFALWSPFVDERMIRPLVDAGAAMR